MTIDEHILANPILRGLKKKFEQYGEPGLNNDLETQTAKGLIKYPNTVNPDDYSVDGWISHNRQELVDSCVYSEVLLAKSEMIPEEFIHVYEYVVNKIMIDNINNMNSLIELQNHLKTYKA